MLLQRTVSTKTRFFAVKNLFENGCCGAQGVSVLENGDCGVHGPSALQSASFTTSPTRRKLFLVKFPRPIVAFNNWMYGALARGYFNQEFNLKEFCETCPLVVEHILQSLSSERVDDLKEAIEPQCLEEIIKKWDLLSVPQRNFLSSLKSDDIQHQYPTIRMRMLKSDPGESIPAFLNIQIQIFYFVNQEHFSSKTPKLKDLNIPAWPIFYRFTFEQEITKGVKGSWKLQSCDEFPSFKDYFDKFF